MNRILPAFPAPTRLLRSFAAASVIGAGLAAAPAARGAEPLIAADTIGGTFSANAALVSEYFFRGISQTDDVPALQGGFDYEHDSGIYLGIWSSNVKFNDASLETDFYGGISGDLFGTGIGWSAGFIYYWYPGAASALNYDLVEATAGLSYDFGFASAEATFNWSPDYFGASGDGFYPALNVDVPLGRYFTASAHVGHQSIDDNAAFGTPDYVDYSFGVSTNVIGFDVGVTYTDTDMSDAECNDACGMAVFSIGRSF